MYIFNIEYLTKNIDGILSNCHFYKNVISDTLENAVAKFSLKTPNSILTAVIRKEKIDE